MPNKALFYPYIDIKDEQWLKTSLLYWDQLYTIVPESIDNPYSSDATRFLKDAGILQPIRVHSNMPEIEEITDSVITYLSTKAGTRMLAANKNQNSNLVRLHVEKLHHEKLHHEIKHKLLGIKNGDWLNVDRNFAEFYMTLLATKLSKQNGASLVTSDSIANDLAIAVHLDAPLDSNLHDNYSSRRRIIRPSEIAEGLLANLAISKITINDETPIEDLINFKDRYSDELGCFHREIRTLCNEIKGDIPLEALQERVSTIYQNNVTPSINNLKAALDGKGIGWKLDGLTSIAFLSATPYTYFAIAGMNPSVTLLAAAGISLIACKVRYNLEKREHLRNAPFAYLLNAKKEFGNNE
jgi:hypothetical protein